MRSATYALYIFLLGSMSLVPPPGALAVTAAQPAITPPPPPPPPPPNSNAATAISESFVRIAKSGLARYGRGCLNSPSCRLSAAEQVAMTRIVNKMNARDEWPSFAFEDRSDSGDAVSRWSNAGKTQIIFSTDALIRREPQGGYEPFSIFRAVRELTLRVGETIPGIGSETIESSAEKLQIWLQERAEVARLGTQRRLVAIDLGQRNAFTELLLADDSHVIRLEPLIASKLTCPAKDTPIGARVWSVHWAHGVPGPIFKQPLRGRLNLFCNSGDKLGDDVLFEMNFDGDHLVSEDIAISILECSKLGCYPKRDTNGAP